MDKDLKDKWCAALRSGQYKQTNGVLESNEGNCCLGVLCRVLELPVALKEEFSGVVYFDNNEGHNNVISPILREKIGLSDKDQDILWEMNDCDKKSFKEIADYIEANVA